MSVIVRVKKDKPHLGCWVFISHKGQRKSICVGDRKSAEEVARLIRRKLALGSFDLKEEEAKPLLGPYFRNWLETHASIHCKESTAAGYETAFRLYIEPALGYKDMREITRADVRELATSLLKAEKSSSYVKATLAPLSAVLNRAIEDGLITTNPALRIFSRSRLEKEKKRVDFLTREELSHLLDVCRRHFPKHYPFVLLLARTGLRLGEAVALQWEDIDFHSRFLEVQRNYVDGRIYTPKSGKGRRVDMSLQLTQTLKELLARWKEETLKKGWKEMPPWVAISEAGTLMNPDNFRKRVWSKLLAKAGLRQIRIQDLRHTFASLLIQQGESLVYVKEQMGHHSIRVTVDIYGHLAPGGNKAAVDRLDDAPDLHPIYTLEHETSLSESAK